ncbi:hypothetical protein J1N35_034221 [Gossypium stocksii]|uniref:Large ribosomal subunit protein uL18 C-terminal eukaryotes domain-containing protein n=1 Tax=Gossypium stocksii TaxID=47602 RepID=A0A9D3URX8_9ROSI|nr:hypothetical protein J1N35_034221 [Gossypium stocksii]
MFLLQFPSSRPFAIAVEGPHMWAAGWKAAVSEIGPQFIWSITKFQASNQAASLGTHNILSSSLFLICFDVQGVSQNFKHPVKEYVLKKVHAAIRADPTAKKTEKEPPKQHKRFNLKKLTYEERKAKLIERLHTLNAAASADSEEED